MLSGRSSSTKSVYESAHRRPSSAPVSRANEPGLRKKRSEIPSANDKRVLLAASTAAVVVAPKPIRPSSAGTNALPMTKQRPLSATKRRLVTSQFIPTDTADWIAEIYQTEPSNAAPEPCRAITCDFTPEIGSCSADTSSAKMTLVATEKGVPQFPSPAPDLDPLQTSLLLPDPTPLPIDLFDDPNPPHPPLSPPKTLPTWPTQLPLTTAPSGTSLFHGLECPTWTYDWSQCHILSFDPLTNRYLIHFSSIQVDKWVSRLNLCFDCESRAHFNARRSAAWHARAQWQAQVELWHQVAAVRLRAPTMPTDVSQRILGRLMAREAWNGIERKPLKHDWMIALGDYEWHWQFAMKQAAMFEPSDAGKAGSSGRAIHSVRADQVLPKDKSIVVWDGAWATVTVIRQSLMDTLGQAFIAEFATHGNLENTSPPILKPLQDWCKAMSAKCERIEHKVLVHWRAAAAKAIANVPCLGSIYTKVPRLVDCIVHTLFQEAVERVYVTMLDAARLDQQIGAPFTRPRISVELVIESSSDSHHALRMEPTAVEAREMIARLMGKLHQALSERWMPFSSDETLITGNTDSTASALRRSHHGLVAPDPTPELLHLARAYSRGNALVAQLSTCLWLLDPGPESVCYTQDPSPSSDCVWRTDMLTRIDKILSSLTRCRPVLFDRSPTAPTIGEILHFDMGNVIRRLRARWRLWDTCCRKQLAHVFATSCTQLESIYTSTTQALHIQGVGTDANTWTVLSQTLSHQHSQLDLTHAVSSQLATWWSVCYTHQVDLSDAESTRYWSAIAIPRQLAWEYAMASEELTRSRADFVKRVRVTSGHITASLGAHEAQLADIARERQASEATKVARRVAALRVRVEKLVSEREGLILQQRAIGMRTDELHLQELQEQPKLQRPDVLDADGNARQHETWPGVVELMHKVLRTSRLWDTAVAIQDALATYRKTFFTQLPRDALGTQLISWKEALVGLLIEYPTNAVEDANARHVVDQVHEQCAAIANMWPILYALSSPHLQMRHWFQITKRIGLAAHDLEMLTLEQVLDQKLDLLTDILLTGAGAHRLIGWEVWEMPLTDAAIRERERRGSKLASMTSSLLAVGGAGGVSLNSASNVHLPPAALPPGQEALAITIRNNSIHLDAVPNGPHLWPSISRTIAGAHGPTTKQLNRHQVTIPFTRIVSIQIRPLDARRYLTRELEWLAWNGSKKLLSLTVGGDQDERLECVDEEDDEAEAAPTSTMTPSARCSLPSGGAEPGDKPAKGPAKSHPTIPTVSTTINGHTAVRRGIWCTRRGNVFYYVACSVEESVGDPVLEAQLMGQSTIALYLEPVEDEIPLSKVVVSVPRGVTPELFAERVQNACARELITE